MDKCGNCQDEVQESSSRLDDDAEDGSGDNIDSDDDETITDQRQ